MSYDKELAFAIDLAKKAGDIMRQYFMGDDSEKVWKTDRTPLTIADTTINDMVIDAVKKDYPGHGVLGEEASFVGDSKYLWICDPIDGTMPYSHNVPIATFNLALCKDGVTQVSVVYDPFCDRLFTAVLGQGAYLNGKKLDASKTKAKLDNSRKVIDLSVWGGSTSSIFVNKDIERIVRGKLDRLEFLPLYFCSGAYSVVLVAAGGLDASLFTGSNPWDVTACGFICAEAGIKTTDIFGQPFSRMDQPARGIMVARHEVHDELVSLLGPIFAAETLRK